MQRKYTLEVGEYSNNNNNCRGKTADNMHCRNDFFFYQSVDELTVYRTSVVCVLMNTAIVKYYSYDF